MKVNYLNTAAALLLAGFAVNAMALTDVGDLEVSANVEATCVLDDASLDFGNVNLFTGATANAIMTLTCSSTAGSIDVTVNGGQHTSQASGDYSYAMANAAVTDFLQYNLCFTNSVTANQCTDTWVAATYLPTFTGAVADIPFFGFINAGDQVGSNLPAGTYTDTVEVTVTY